MSGLFAVQFYVNQIKVLLLFVVAAALKTMKSTIENDERTLTAANCRPLMAILITVGRGFNRLNHSRVSLIYTLL